MTLDAKSSVMPLVVVAAGLDGEGSMPSTTDAADRLHRQLAGVDVRRREAAAALQRLQPLLSALSASDHLKVVARYPLLGMLIVEADGAARQALANSPDVRAAFAERRHRLPHAYLEDAWPPSDLLALPSLLPSLIKGGGPDPAPEDSVGAREVSGSGGARLGGAEGTSWSQPSPNVEAVGAPRAWAELAATGQGVTVAVLDSGVDWRHPALSSSYRGRGGNHDHAWFDAAEGAAEPIDPNGHGTHVTGLIVGRAGQSVYGVAPGATWIAARAFNADGEATDRQLLAAAEWLLAPTPLRGGSPRPDLAPDIVNGSWGLESSADPLFEAVLSAWRAAGIVAVFAAGNDETANPPGAVLAPASASLALAVGALQPDGTVRTDSRGGPGLAGGVKPDLTAPGSGTVSTEPGGGVGRRSGTSMAAPHVAGAIALLLGLNPRLLPADVQRILAATAVDAGPPGPDDRFGWGRLDAYAAARAALGGRLAGRVHAQGEQFTLRVQPLPSAAPWGWPEDLAAWQVSPEGEFDLALPAGRFAATVEGFGYEPATHEVAIVRGEMTRWELTLQPLRRAEVTGQIRSAQGALGSAAVQVLEAASPANRASTTRTEAASIRASGEIRTSRHFTQAVDTPFRPTDESARPAASKAVAADACALTPEIIPAGRVLESAEAEEGRLRLSLPVGRLLLRVAAPGHRSVLRYAEVVDGGVDLGEICLPLAPALLVVDADAWPSGDWYQERIAPYLRQPLIDAGYPHTMMAVEDPAAVPGLGVLARFDAVWWAHQFGSPGTLDAARGDTKVTSALAAYLGGGGSLILSGQDVGWRDAADGAPQYRLAPDFYRNVLGVRLVDGITGDRGARPAPWLVLSGLAGLVQLAWPQGRVKGYALRPDVLAPAGLAGTQAAPLASYAPSGATAALGVAGPRGRHVTVGFGPESGGDRVALAQLMDGLIGWLDPVLVDLRPTMAARPAIPFALEPAGQVTLTLGATVTLAAGIRAGRAASDGELVVRLPPALAPADAAAQGWERVGEETPRWQWRFPFALEGHGATTRTLDIQLVQAVPGGEPLMITATAGSGGRQKTATAQVWPYLPDLGASRLALAPARVAAGNPLTATLVLSNKGPSPAEEVEGTIIWPAAFDPQSSTASASTGRLDWLSGADGNPAGLAWHGEVPTLRPVTVTIAGRVPTTSTIATDFVATITDTAAMGWPDTVLHLSSSLLANGPRLALPLGLVAPAAVVAGDAFAVQALLANSGPVTAAATAGLVLPPGVDPGIGGGGLAFDPATRTFAWQGDVAPGGTRLAVWPVTTAPGRAAGSATLRLDLSDGLAPETPPAQAETTLRVQSAALTAEASLSPEGASPGEWLVGRVALANDGDAAVPVDVVDSLPARVQLDEASVVVSRGLVTHTTATMNWQLVLGPGERAELSYRAKVGASVEANTPLAHVARVRVPGGEMVRAASITAHPLALDKSTLEAFPPSPAPGGQLYYTLTVRSIGTAEARNLSVRVRLPDGAALVPSSVGGGLVQGGAEGAMSWQGRLAAGESRRFGWRMQVPATLRPGARLLVLAEIDAKGVPPLALQTASVVASTDLSGSSKSVNRSVARTGEVVTFSLRATCGGPEAASLTLTDALPPGLEIVGGTLRASSGVVAWDGPSRSLRWQGTLAGGEAALVSFSTLVTAAPGTRIVNAARFADDAGTHVAAWAEVGVEMTRAYLPLANAP